MMIAGKECEGCRYYDELENLKNKIYCSKKMKTFWYGMYIPECEDKEKIKNGND